jgi:hypothetical protein
MTSQATATLITAENTETEATVQDAEAEAEAEATPDGEAEAEATTQDAEAEAEAEASAQDNIEAAEASVWTVRLPSNWDSATGGLTGQLCCKVVSSMPDPPAPPLSPAKRPKKEGNDRLKLAEALETYVNANASRVLLLDFSDATNARGDDAQAPAGSEWANATNKYILENVVNNTQATVGRFNTQCPHLGGNWHGVFQSANQRGLPAGLPRRTALVWPINLRPTLAHFKTAMRAGSVWYNTEGNAANFEAAYNQNHDHWVPPIAAEDAAADAPPADQRPVNLGPADLLSLIQFLAQLGNPAHIQAAVDSLAASELLQADWAKHRASSGGSSSFSSSFSSSSSSSAEIAASFIAENSEASAQDTTASTQNNPETEATRAQNNTEVQASTKKDAQNAEVEATEPPAEGAAEHVDEAHHPVDTEAVLPNSPTKHGNDVSSDAESPHKRSKKAPDCHLTS